VDLACADVVAFSRYVGPPLPAQLQESSLALEMQFLLLLTLLPQSTLYRPGFALFVFVRVFSCFLERMVFLGYGLFDCRRVSSLVQEVAVVQRSGWVSTVSLSASLPFANRRIAQPPAPNLVRSPSLFASSTLAWQPTPTGAYLRSPLLSDSPPPFPNPVVLWAIVVPNAEIVRRIGALHVCPAFLESTHASFFTRTLLCSRYSVYALSSGAVAFSFLPRHISNLTSVSSVRPPFTDFELITLSLSTFRPLSRPATSLFLD